MGKHTDAFNNQLKEGENRIKSVNVPSTTVIEFCSRLSSELFREVCTKLRAKYGKNTYLGNREVYDYCQEFGIEPDKKPFGQKEDPKKHYHLLEKYQDIKVENRECFVKNNDTENKILTVMFHDDSEIQDISY